jgi:hypothetical protein
MAGLHCGQLSSDRGCYCGPFDCFACALAVCALASENPEHKDVCDFREIFMLGGNKIVGPSVEDYVG